ncbi:hypothetical protein ASPSYDRAFT_1155817 [Aspergillus sydowii CBS 593.65]|uniref:HECT-type E3 ubiquitin transferase n=1 Tax=Aspergillus sydowii CBS 593.65 TaxID=1036612 RepID=A0A1L9TY83_9EURO|nr:uncharacterized protein ASPSYDRAFT_1155817 [Aspergillus sydowii CBS 593.65]OJJ64397.1 hypothetical protein ASPSYDRAFT_1155817 [Aspergillus sydowii CBS 593.65]
MGKIKKVAGQKHEATLSPYLADFVGRATTVPVPELPSHLRTFSRVWPFPRGDLYHWINVLNRFDEILASAIDRYGLGSGPQTTPFSRQFITQCYTSEDPKLSSRDIETKLAALEYGPEGDRELLEAVLDFSRLLLEKCGNRSLYNSSERLGELLNTTSLTLLQSTLRLSLSLAQRYHSRHRGGSHLQQSLLATHYNIDLEKLQKIAAPFARPSVNGRPVSSPQGVKAKEKAPQTKQNANELTSLAREGDGWDEWGHVHLLYYPSGPAEQAKSGTESGIASSLIVHAPSSPTPFHRSHTISTPRAGRIPSTENSPASVSNTPAGKQEESLPGGKTLDIPGSTISASSTEETISLYSKEVPDDSKYELLNKIRTAKGLSGSQSTREQILAIRILAITNLAYVYPEPLFQQKILQFDMEHPKRLQLAYQLGELVHLGASGDLPVSRTVQTFSIQALDALAKHKARAIDVCGALSVNVNHGVLMFLTRKAVNELSVEGDENDDGGQDEWRDALLALLRTLPGSSTRTPETLVAAGLIPMFVDVLNLRTHKARRVYSRVMEFLDSFVLAVRDAFGILTNAKGFDALSDLIDYETKTSFGNVSRGAGIPDYYKTSSIDYQIPYFQQQTLRWLFRFVNHIMQHNGGGFDRVLRNLIDSPQLLTSLRLVIENAPIFGSHVWSNAVNILSSFIHNEPTSYQVIAEAGLSKSFLEAITLSKLKAQETAVEGASESPSAAETGEPTSAPNLTTDPSGGQGQKPRDYTAARPKDACLAPGIMPATEALSCIPSAFGAICLNASGLELFQSSHALESFFEIFENPAHVKCLIKDDTNLVRSLGSTFDELVRHHPALKSSIMTAVMVMVARVGFLCRTKAWSYGMGAKLWKQDSQGKPILSGEPWQLLKAVGLDASGHGASGDEDIYGVPTINADAPLPNGGRLSVGDVTELLPPLSAQLEPKDEDKDGLTTTDYLFAVLRFLGAFFENQSNCTYFIESGGVEFVLDLATLQSLPFDFHNTDANQELTVLVHMLVETKPHLVMPSLLCRTERIVDMLADFWRSSEEQGFFFPLVQLEKEGQGKTASSVDESFVASSDNGTFFAKHMVSALILVDLLREAFSTPLYQSRPSQQTSVFAQVNLTDRYCALVKKLGSLHAACVWEEILLEKNIPDTWDQATKVQQPPSDRPVDGPGILAEGVSNIFSPEPRQGGPTGNNSPNPQTPQQPNDIATKPTEGGVAFKNVQALRYLLSSLPSSITGYLHNLGLCLIGKRRVDAYQKQNAIMAADVIAGAVLEQLQFKPANSSGNPKLRFAYLIVILSSFSHLLFEAAPDRHHSHYLTLVLFAFKRNNGLRVLKDVCDLFVNEVKALTPRTSVPDSENDLSARLTSAFGGIKMILGFFAELSSGKSIVDSSQTQAMASNERDRGRPDYFQAGQFLVDLRMDILPIAREMWNSDFATQSTSSVVKCLVDILRSSLDGEYETSAARQSDAKPALVDVQRKGLTINKDRANNLQEKGFDSRLVQEALYRCNNSASAAEEYCRAQSYLRAPDLVPPEPSDIEAVRSAGEGPEDPAGPEPPSFDTGSLFDRQSLSMFLAQAQGRPADDGNLQDTTPGMPEEITRALTHILSQGSGDDDRDATSASNQVEPSIARASNSADPSEQTSDQQNTRRRELTTVEDLDTEREKVRSNLIERCLDVLNEHYDVSFELSDLIASAIKKHRDPESFRREIGELLVQSLVSLQMEDFQESGKKVAAYAHLLALVVQDRDMYNATLTELKECFTTFLQFIALPSEKARGESFPWVGHVLLVLEKLLSDDAQPPHIRWTLPDNADPSPTDEGPAQLEEPLVSRDEKMQLFEVLVEILPRIGKDDTLALSVCRILVILTRNHSIAVRLGEKQNLQRLFVMVKQLTSSTNEKLQGAFMLILRHIIEDDDTIRQIMRSEIVANFESKSTRPIDTTGYVRQMYHLVLRSPEIFVEISNEKLKLQRYDTRQRPQILTLKADKKTGADAKQNQDPEGPQDAGEKKSDTAQGEKEKGKTAELKTPVVEKPDGVIHYLLSELLSYKDVDDQEPQPSLKQETSAPGKSETQTDVEMSTDEPALSVSTTEPQGSRNPKKSEKPAFQADDHPIYIYRCFLLQCLTELLSSYNQTKVEFINFSRKADPLATTPSKPRSGVLNYLLNALVPIGTMDHDESVAFKKRSNTSAWTMRVLVALCTKTGEFGGNGRRRNDQSLKEDDEPELAFVRRFVLEHALKAYKEANSSNEALDVKYSRLMSLADLFDKMLSGYAFVSGDTAFPSSTKQLAKTMFEKHFIAALTASVAEIDLNFPSSKRVIKYILRPLNKLTQTAVILSENSDISTIGGSEDDEISSATSVSDMDDEREETPDLFRHSTLGMLEPRHEEETSSEESEEEDDDEMYDDEYGEEMDYEEDIGEDDGEVISDEEDDIEGVGPIEGLPGDSGMDIEVVIDDEDDEDDDEDDDGHDEDDHSEMDDEILAGEITGDRDNESFDEGDEDEWESEEMSDDDDEADIMNQLEDEFADIRQADQGPEGQRFDDIFRALNEAAGGVEDLQADSLGDLHDDMVDDDLNEDDEDEEIDELEEELEDADEDQGSYHGFDDDEDLVDPWGWDGDEPPLPRTHHHHRFRGNNPAWAAVTGIMPSRHGIVPIPSYRLQRSQVPPRGNDDGTNPLLVRTDRGPEAPGQRRGATNAAFTDWVHGMEPVSTGRLLPMDSPVSFMNAIMQAMGQSGGPGFGIIHRPDGIHVHVDRHAILPSRIQDIFGLGRPQPPPARTRDDPSQAVSFALATTRSRWQEEARILFSSTYPEKTQRVVNSLLKILVPPALEEQRQRDKEMEEEAKRREEERAERERIAKEEEEKERKRKEEEETARQQQEREQQVAEREASGTAPEPMDDVQQTEATAEASTTVQPAQPEPGPAEPARRVHTTIRGRQVDITGMEIDPEYLEALPEDLREEVIMQQLAEQRSQAAAAGEEPSEINPEFLEALPPEIREELLQQEAADRRRRERENARRQAGAGPAAPAPAHAEEMDPASFLATLDPSLREAVLADQPEEILATLGPEYVTEARAVSGARGRLAQFSDIPRMDHRHRTEQVDDQEPKKQQRRQIVQMLDKAGVATLLRLMFMPLQGNARHQLNDILHNVCENRQNRIEVISLLLSVLQDGSTDVSAIERSFAQLSLRAKSPAVQKTPQSVKRSLGLQSSNVSNDVTPIMVVQQCLGTLSFLSQYNPHIAWFFLTEHDPASALKLKAFRKGKGKENKANKFALNALLSLLDRKLILESPNCMEQLSSLLASITQPLTLLLRREKEKQAEEEKGKKPESTEVEQSAERQQGTGPSETTETANVVADTNMTDAPAAEDGNSQGATAPTQPQNENPADAKTETKKGEDEKHKRRTIEPPIIPEFNLKLVVHVLAARECNGKIFRDALSTINNISAVPGARDTIGNELVSQAQTLSTTILLDLDELISHVHEAQNGTDMQGLALAKFSPASSDQAKLLRVLTALDYLFDPNRADKSKGNELDGPAKDVLQTLYESSTFGPLWTRLSECLTLIRKKENMMNVATILLPLVEALMVVCKNTTLKDTSLARNSRELSVSSGSGDSNVSMESLFFKFTEEHRKILNELVRQNPRLMSGTFSLLVKNPKVLEFDNKRNYFTRRVHSRGAEPRHPHPPLQLAVRRDQVFLDSFRSLYFKSADELKHGKLNVRFHGEEGVDAGGVTREWFQVLARGMFNPDYALFIPVAADRTTFHPNRLSAINPEHLMFFKFIGRIIGKALYEGRVLDCHFSRAVYKCILGRNVSIKDMETLDLDYYKSLLWMLENDITDIITETFALETDAFGEKQVIDLIENGRNIPVTQENKEEYVQKVVDYRLVVSVQEQLDNFLKGFHEIIPPELISIFNEQELELLISGLPEVEVDDWKAHTEYHNYSASSPQIQWFWRAVRSFDKEERAKLLQFVTGTSKVPLNGFKELEGMNGVSRFNIHRDYGNKDRLPSSHTCFNQLDLPEYDSYETLRQRLHTAITTGSEYFGFA